DPNFNTSQFSPCVPVAASTAPSVPAAGKPQWWAAAAFAPEAAALASSPESGSRSGMLVAGSDSSPAPPGRPAGPDGEQGRGQAGVAPAGVKAAEAWGVAIDLAHPDLLARAAAPPWAAWTRPRAAIFSRWLAKK